MHQGGISLYIRNRIAMSNHVHDMAIQIKSTFSRQSSM